MKTQRSIPRMLLVSVGLMTITLCHSFSATNEPRLVNSLGTKVCDVRSNPNEYVGRGIRFRATYKSDHMFYSYLSDDSCRSKRTLDVAHPVRTNGDTSVVNFFRDEDERCRVIGASVCPVKVEMDVEALISMQADGSVLAEFKKIWSYKFY